MSKTTETTQEQTFEPVKLTVEQLFESKKFKLKYPYDMAKVVLGNKLYTVTEATTALDKVFETNKGGNK